MSYCVHLRRGLDATASFCPCAIRVLGPQPTGGYRLPKPFPHPTGEVAPAAKQEVASLITAMLASVAVSMPRRTQSVSAGGRDLVAVRIGAAAMLWLWLVPPLGRGCTCSAAVAGYHGGGPVRLSDLGGSSMGGLVLGLGAHHPVGAGRSFSCWGWCCPGLPPVGPHYADDSDHKHWSLCVRNGSFLWTAGRTNCGAPSWSLVVLTICIGMVIRSSLFAEPRPREERAEGSISKDVLATDPQRGKLE